MSSKTDHEKNEWRWMADFRESVRREWQDYTDLEEEGVLIRLLRALAYEKREEAVVVIFEEMERVGQQREEFIASFANKLDRYDLSLSRIYQQHEGWSEMVCESRDRVKKRTADDTITKLWEEFFGQEWWIGLGCEEGPGHYGNWTKVRKFARAWSKLYDTEHSIFFWLDEACQFKRKYTPTRQIPAVIQWDNFTKACDLMLGSDGEIMREAADAYQYRYYDDVDDSSSGTEEDTTSYIPRLRASTAIREERWIALGRNQLVQVPRRELRLESQSSSPDLIPTVNEMPPVINMNQSIVQNDAIRPVSDSGTASLLPSKSITAVAGKRGRDVHSGGTGGQDENAGENALDEAGREKRVRTVQRMSSAGVFATVDNQGLGETDTNEERAATVTLGTTNGTPNSSQIAVPRSGAADPDLNSMSESNPRQDQLSGVDSESTLGSDQEAEQERDMETGHQASPPVEMEKTSSLRPGLRPIRQSVVGRCDEDEMYDRGSKSPTSSNATKEPKSQSTKEKTAQLTDNDGRRVTTRLKPPPPHPRNKRFGPSVRDDVLVDENLGDPNIRPPGGHLATLFECDKWQGSKHIISELGWGKFEEDEGGYIDARRVVPVWCLSGESKEIQRIYVVIPHFEGWESVAKLLRDAVSMSEEPSGNIGIKPGHGTITEQDMQEWFAEHGGYAAVWLPGHVKSGIQEHTFERSVERHNLGGIKFNFQDMAWAPDILKGERIFEYDRVKTTVETIMRTFPPVSTDGSQKQRHALYCLEGTAYDPLDTLSAHHLAAECLGVRSRWEDEEDTDHLGSIIDAFPLTVPFSGDDPAQRFRRIKRLPWSMADRSKSHLKVESVVDSLLDKFVRWFLINSAGSLSLLHCDAAGSFTVGTVESGYKLWIIIHCEDGESYSNRKVDCLLLRATDTLIIRPGVQHCVYTIANSVMTGSHFYRLANLGESLHTRRKEARADQAPTNECLPIGHAFAIWYGHELCREDFEDKYEMERKDRLELLDDIRRTLQESIFQGLQCPYPSDVELQEIVDVLTTTAKCASALETKMENVMS